MERIDGRKPDQLRKIEIIAILYRPQQAAASSPTAEHGLLRLLL